MNKKKLPVSLNIALTLKAIEHAFKKSMHELNFNLPSESFGILMIAYFQENVIQQDIADMAKKDKSAVLKQIDVLEAKGLVQRQVNARDRREKMIVITDEGRKIAAEIIDREREMLCILSQGIEKREMNAFLKVLSLLKANAEKS
ncbi:MAG: MarR family transcriptional regulator [Prevotellaceae bacterium]|jgi:DNA-binding MarR family transcriptional regulator|nr:MarR family transcriptional regulator [Prevotellaceae bacterium]